MKIIQTLKNKLFSLISVGLILILLSSCEDTNKAESQTTAETNPEPIANKFPTEFLNKPLYVSPYFVCRDNIFIDNDLNFTYTIYSIGTMASAEQAIVKGKLNSDGSITFNGSNKYQFQGYYMPAEILNKWDINNSCYGSAKCFSVYVQINNQRTQRTEVYDISFTTDECQQGY